jgi:predicted enzyme related to lactoylglutathione lyase
VVQRSGIVIMLGQLEKAGLMRPNHSVDPEAGAWDVYVWIDDADAVHAESVAKAVKIARKICDQPHGCRELAVEDLNGYRLCFGQDIAS